MGVGALSQNGAVLVSLITEWCSFRVSYHRMVQCSFLLSQNGAVLVLLGRPRDWWASLWSDWKTRMASPCMTEAMQASRLWEGVLKHGLDSDCCSLMPAFELKATRW